MANLKDTTKELRLAVASKAEAASKLIVPEGRDTIKDLLDCVAGLKNISIKNESRWADVASYDLLGIHIELFKIFQLPVKDYAELIESMNQLNVALGNRVTLTIPFESATEMI